MSLHTNPPKAVFTGGACAHCYKFDSAAASLLKCGGCKHAWYCSKQCQTEHWPQHKRTCKAVGALAQLISKERKDDPPTSQQEFNISAAKCAMALATMQKRPIEPSDSLLFGTEAHCPMCYRTRDTLPEGVSLRNCRACSWGWACTQHWEQVQQRHKTCCAKYAMLNRVEVLLQQHVQEEEALPSWCSEQVMAQPQRLPEGGWREYQRWRPVPNFRDEYFAAVTTYLSQPLTTLLGLQHHYAWDKLAALDSLTVHVAGAAHQDGPMQAAAVWEELMHLLPRVKRLHVVFVGPDMRHAFIGPIRPEPLQVGTCMQCESDKRLRLYSVCPLPYHEYVRQRHYCKPTVVVAFNSGCGMEVATSRQRQQQHQQAQQAGGQGQQQQQEEELAAPPPSSWQPTLQHLVAHGVPCIFTCYNSSEARDDAQVVQQAGGALSQEPRLNPYSGLVEYPDVEDPFSFYRSSMYYFCFKGRA